MGASDVVQAFAWGAMPSPGTVDSVSGVMHAADKGARGRIGTIVGKYRLDGVLGEGGMAVVYRATHLRNGHRVALKILHPGLGRDADIRARFLREGYVANKVGHRGVVRVLDDDVTDDGTVFLVMDLLAGETLDARWTREGKRLDVADVAFTVDRVLEVLAASHRKHIVHRDIKPQNVFVTDEGAVRVLDFGIARLREASSAGTETRTGRRYGTPSFMPPEQALGRRAEIDEQTDLWAAGAMAFTLLSGRFVHEAESPEEQMVMAATRPARSLASVAPGTPDALVRVVDRALAFAKSDRWPSASTMRDALREAYKESYGVSIPAAFSPRSGPASAPTSSEGKIAHTLPTERYVRPRPSEARVAAAPPLDPIDGDSRYAPTPLRIPLGHPSPYPSAPPPGAASPWPSPTPDVSFDLDATRRADPRTSTTAGLSRGTVNRRRTLRLGGAAAVAAAGVALFAFAYRSTRETAAASPESSTLPSAERAAIPVAKPPSTGVPDMPAPEVTIAAPAVASSPPVARPRAWSDEARPMTRTHRNRVVRDGGAKAPSEDDLYKPN